MDHDELRRMANRDCSSVCLHPEELRDLLDALERADADVSHMADENANLRNRCAMLSFEEAEALLMLEKAERERADAIDAMNEEREVLAATERQLQETTDRAEKTERERDEARAERDARPDISAEDAAVFTGDHATSDRAPAYARVASALRAHAAKAVKP